MHLRYSSAPNRTPLSRQDATSVWRYQSDKDAGFTLIELLTVIAIIGILAAILIPVASSVREKAKKAQCISNLHQIGIALIGYANDNKGRIPVGWETDGRGLWEKDPDSDARISIGLGSLQYYGYISGASGVAVTGSARSRIFDCPTRMELGWDRYSNWGDYWYNFTGKGSEKYYDPAGALLYSLPEGRAIVYDIASDNGNLTAIHDKGRSANVLYPNGAVRSFLKSDFKSDHHTTCFNLQ